LPDSKRIKELKDQLQQKDQFLATISHEIRSPMSGVFGMADALLRTKLNSVQKRYLTVLMDSCESMLSIANQVLEISKSSSGQARLAPVDVDLNDFIAMQVAGFESRAKARNLDLVTDINFQADPRVHLDKFRLAQVLSNLISNALRYTDKGRIVVRAILMPRDGKFLDLTLIVEDTGIGMTKKASKRIFDAFQSANPIESAARGGTGLGLTVVRNLVDLMQGEISVESTPGKGTVFTTKFVVETSKTELHSLKPMRKAMPANLNILLAEDNDSNAFVFKVMLEETGVKITHARDGTEAVEKASESEFDVIFMDIQMPRMNGIEATTKIRALEAEKFRSATSIIALSADVFVSQASEFQAAGFNYSLSKPVRQSELLDVMSTLDKGVKFD